MAQSTKAQIPNPPEGVVTNLDEKIRQRAYELYEARGREDGHDVEDWLQAEAEFFAEESHIHAA